MEYRALGRTGLRASAVSVGTGSLGELFGPLAEPDALRLVDEVQRPMGRPEQLGRNA